MSEILITKEMIGELIKNFPDLLDNIEQPFRECAVCYYTRNTRPGDLEEIAGHLLEGIAIVKKIRPMILNSAVILLYKKGRERK